MHSIAPYQLAITDSCRSHNDKFCALNDIRGVALHSLFSEFVSKITSDYVFTLQDGNKSAFKFSDCHCSEGEIYGYIESGGSGKKGKVIDTDNGQELAKYGAKHANTTRKFFLIRYKPSEKSASLFMHQISGEGSKTQLLQQFTVFVKQKFEALTPRIDTLTFKSALKKWREEAVVKEVRGYYLSKAEDTSDMFNGFVNNHRVEVISRPPGFGMNFGKLDGFGKKEDVQKLVAFEQSEPVQIKVKIEMNGKPKVMSLFSNKEPICTVDFTHHNVDFDDGEPKLNSILTFCRELSDGMGR